MQIYPVSITRVVLLFHGSVWWWLALPTVNTASSAQYELIHTSSACTPTSAICTHSYPRHRSLPTAMRIPAHRAIPKDLFINPRTPRAPSPVIRSAQLPPRRLSSTCCRPLHHHQQTPSQLRRYTPSMDSTGAWGAWQAQPSGFTQRVVSAMRKL